MTLDDLARLGLDDDPPPTVREVADAYVRAVLTHHSGNKVRSSRALGISLKTLYNRLNSWELAGVPYADELQERREIA